jgi:DNA-binding MarR family transcriptional regulator
LPDVISTLDRARAIASHLTLEQGITERQFLLLHHLAKKPRSPTELADLLHVTAPSVTATTRPLLDLGYLTITPHPRDRKRRIVAITPEGSRALRAVYTELLDSDLEV